MVAAIENLELTDEAINAAFETLTAHRLTQRECPSCKKVLPLVPAAFRPEPGSVDGYSKLCVVCDVEEQRTLILSCIAEANLQLNIALHRRAIGMASRASDSDHGVPHLKSLFQRTVEAFGGPEGLAAAKVSTFLAAKEGSMHRIKILDGIDRMGIKVTEAGQADLDIEKMTEDELIDYRKRIEDKLQEQLASKNQLETTAERVA